MGREIGGTESAQVGVNFENDRTKVQSLFEQGVSEIPSKYVRNENERCTLQESFGRGIPVIDLSKDATQVAEEIGRACSEWGFFQVRVWYNGKEMNSKFNSFGGDCIVMTARPNDRVINVLDWIQLVLCGIG